jgi:DNA-directed RNA polymerase specialized sigma24 family protein
VLTSDARGRRHRAAANLKGLNDPILASLFDAADDEERRAAIGGILERVQPLVTAIVRRFKRSEPALRAEDAEELVAVVLLRVLRKLQLTALLESERIEKLEGYVATLTKNVLHDFRRRRFPERTRLKNKLRYILTHDLRFTVRLEDDEMLCALADAPALAGVAPLPTLADATPRMRDERRPADAVAAVLAHAGRPIALSTLIDTLIEIWNIRETPVLSEPLQQAAPAEQLSTLE